MAESVLRLKVDNKEYDQKIKRATDGLLAMEKACRRVGSSLSSAGRDELEFARALGRMETTANSSKGRMKELTNAILDLQGMYSRLSAEEKSSQFGRALAASMDELKRRTAELRDRTADLNEELKNMASDTAFTDGVNMMSQTVGSCASAMVAWSGDGREMEKVIKDLAKIQTTIAAIEALTKAFQRQNMVLMKNPYVLAAAAIAAIGVAIYEVATSAEEATDKMQEMQDAMDKAKLSTVEETAKIDLLNERLHDNNLAYEERKSALDQLKSIVKDYHGDLSTEGTLIHDNSRALSEYKDRLIDAATAQAAFKKMAENAEKRLELLKKGQAALKAAAEHPESQDNSDLNMAERFLGFIGAGGGGANLVLGSYGNQMLRNVDKGAAETYAQQIVDLDKDTEWYKKQIKTSVINSVGGGGSGGGATPNAGRAKVAPTYTAGIKAEKEEEAVLYDFTKKMDEQFKNVFATSPFEGLQEKVDNTMKDIELEPLEISFEVDNKSLKKFLKETQLEKMQGTADDLSRAFSGAASAVQAFGQDSKEAAMAASALSFAGTIASLMASMAKAQMQNKLGIWEWIAGGLAGAAALGTMVSQMKSAKAQAFADGGEVGGSSFVSDRIPALLNSGEVVLNRNQVSSLTNGLQQNANVSAQPYVMGQQIFVGINNALKANGMGQLVTTKMR